jgi:hypothetical protein
MGRKSFPDQILYVCQTYNVFKNYRTTDHVKNLKFTPTLNDRESKEIILFN